jgi:pantoate--beta-alanine ligase
MRIFHAVKEMQLYARKLRAEGKTIALVPTMGALHEGHLSLMRKARIDCDVLVISIYVNPSQFGPGEDYRCYPRNLDHDVKLAAKVGVDIVFAPTNSEMYPPGFKTSVRVAELDERLCGGFRPHHFQGVCTIVNKLFNIVRPDYAYFGQKDAQQAVIIKRMVADLNMGIEVMVLPIVRDRDGLALSSRNSYLSPGERQAALVLYKSLQLAKELIEAGECQADVIKRRMQDLIRAEELVQLEYIAICELENLTEVSNVSPNTLIALAARVGQARLIDNYLVEGGTWSLSC